MAEVYVKQVPGIKVLTVESLPPHQSGGPARDIDEFIDLVSTALEDYQKRLGTAAENLLKLREMSPKEAIESPDRGLNLSLVRLVDRKLGNKSNEGERRKWRATQIAELDHPEDENIVVLVYVLEMDNVMEFRIVSPHAAQANKSALFFERFMLAYAWYFKEMGIHDIRFQQRLEDSIEEIGGSELHIRPIRYFVRTQQIFQEFHRKVDKIRVQYDAGEASKTTSIDPEFGAFTTEIDRSLTTKTV